MHEELYVPLPDIRAYLDRIGFEGEPDLTLETLHELVYRHHITVPFENFTICEEKKVVDIGVVALFNKIVLGRRGGYCFEVNGLFYSLLIAIGFDAYPALARISRDLDALRPPLHRVSIVRMGDKRYFCDVGYGGSQPAGALELVEETQQTIRGEKFYFYKPDAYNWQLMRYNSQGETVPVVRFPDMPAEQVDFITPNWYTSTHPDSNFVKNRTANIRRVDGHCSIREGQFRLLGKDVDTVIDIQSKEQEFELLKEYFGIVLYQ